jgi:23S rRNA pseudouridine2605 synthase
MHDERGRRSIAGLLPPGRRLFPVGRLDAQTTGLLLCTSDGELCRRLSHPSYEVPRRYRVSVSGVPSAGALRSLRARHVLTDARGTTFEMTLTKGANREIRRACANNGLRVLALERIAYGPITLGSLAPSAYRVLSEPEARALTPAQGPKRCRPEPTE